MFFGAVATDMLAHETLADEAPLKGGPIQVGAIPIQLRVRAPRHRAVIEDDVMHSRLGRPIAQEVIARIVLQIAPHADAQVADDDVVRAVDEPYAPIALGLAVPSDLHAARRGLSGDGEIGRAHSDRGLQRDGAADAEHDNARAGRFHGTPQASLTRILEIRHLDDSSAPAAHRIGPESLRRRERLDGVRCAGRSEQTRTAHLARDFCSAVAGRAPRGGNAGEHRARTRKRMRRPRMLLMASSESLRKGCADSGALRAGDRNGSGVAERQPHRRRPSIHCYPRRSNPQGSRAFQRSSPTPLRLTGFSPSLPKTSAGAVATVLESGALKSNTSRGRGLSHTSRSGRRHTAANSGR